MSENQRSADGFRKALEVFEQHAPDILDITLHVKGRPMRAELLSLLSLGDWHDDLNALSLMADKLPSMLVFYGLALAQAEEDLAALEEEIELFIQERWNATLEKLTKDVDAMVGTDGKKIPSGLKSAPTKDGIRAAIIIGNKFQWDDLKARRALKSMEAKTLSNVHRGIEQRIKLLNNQLFVANSAVNRGITG